MREHFRKYWMLHVGIWWAVFSTALMYVADQYGQLSGALTVWFPKSAQTWVPTVGFLLGLVAQVLRQALVAESLQQFFGKKGGDQGGDHVDPQ